MSQAGEIDLFNFFLAYLLLGLVVIIMQRSQINKTKLLIWAGARMTAQLVLAGFILTHILENPHPFFTVLFLLLITVFSIHRVLSGHKNLSLKFKFILALSLTSAGFFVLFYFVAAILNESLFNPRFTIPLAGMIMGNAMTGLSLGLKSFMTSLKAQKSKTETLVNLGVHPAAIFRPVINEALETSLLPTINSMLGMGIIFLPGMMTGQILSGTSPSTAIMYQIAIMLAICAATCLTVFTALNIGYKTFYNQHQQITIDYL